MKRFNSESVDCAGSSGSSKQPKQSATEPVYEEEEDLDARIRHKNQPVLISVFRDPETEEEKVLCKIVGTRDFLKIESAASHS